jgi:hypothetical protein
MTPISGARNEGNGMGEYLQHQAVRRKKHRRHRLRKILLNVERITRVICVWLVVVGLGYAAYVAIFSQSVFTVEQIVVRGDLHVLDEATVRHVAGVQKGDHLFHISMSSIQDRLRAHPWVREVAVRRKLPNTVWIYVSEREAMVLLNWDGFYLVDKSGNIFKQAEAKELEDLPVVSGLDDIVVDAHGMGRSAALAQLIDVYKLYTNHPIVEYLGCSEVLFDEYGYVSIITEQPAMRLRLGSTPTKNQFDRLYAVLSAVNTSEKKIKTIDLFMERKVVVRYES